MIELVPETYFAPLDFLAIFGRAAPLQVDLGCGDGSFLCELARQKPDYNFLGIDKLAGRIAKACRKSAALENVRILNVESSYAVRHLLPQTSVEIFYLLFPDPWPKRRHHRRRIVTTNFLASIHRALTDGGFFHIATDQLDYFKQMRTVVASTAGKLECMKHSSFREDLDLPVTRFERRFLDQGSPIHRIALRKTSPVT